jgi:hypothetical protein
MDYANTQQSTCSSCIVTKDFSNYWVPSLYYKAQNGSFMSVGQSGGATIYYLQRTDPNDPEYSSGLLAFPEGFRMVAGNPTLRSYNDTLEQNAVSYACLGTSTAETSGFPDIQCPDGLRAQIFFPSCWDGVNLDSPDHKSHMAYPSGTDTGACPASHPKRFISIFYEVIWNTPGFDWYGNEQPFVWAMGDDTGYGYHGDFVNGWDVPTLQDAVTNCNDDSGVIQNCPAFDFFTNEFSQGCLIPTSVDEQVFGVMDALPGCNPVQSGPANAVEQSGCGATTTIGPPELPYVDLTKTKGFEYVGCGTDIAGQPRTLSGASTTDNTGMTVESCVDFCVAAGYTIAGMEFSTQCFCGNSIPAANAPTPGLMGNCMMPCSGDSKEMCGGASLLSLYQKCGSTCQNVQYTVNNSTTGSGTAAGSTVVASSVASGTEMASSGVASGTVMASSAVASSTAVTSADAVRESGSSTTGSGMGGSSVATSGISKATTSTAAGEKKLVGSYSVTNASSAYGASSAATIGASGSSKVVILQTATVSPLPVSSVAAGFSFAAASHPAVGSSSAAAGYFAVASPSATGSSSAAAAGNGEAGGCGAGAGAGTTVTVTQAVMTVTVTVGGNSGHGSSPETIGQDDGASIAASSAAAASAAAKSNPTMSSTPYEYGNGTVPTWAASSGFKTGIKTGSKTDGKMMPTGSY